MDQEFKVASPKQCFFVITGFSLVSWASVALAIIHFAQ